MPWRVFCYKLHGRKNAVVSAQEHSISCRHHSWLERHTIQANFSSLSSYLHSKLLAELEKNDFLHRQILADKRLVFTLWRLGSNIEYGIISHLFGVGISTVYAIVHQVYNATVHTFATQ